VELEFVLHLSLLHVEGHKGEDISTLFSSINSAIWIINWGWGMVYAALLEKCPTLLS
jgi:short subunit fatty acids transporter